jgi:hypothetical protein
MSAPWFLSGEQAALECVAPLHGMKFTLTYDGELPASGNSPKPKDKWEIRRRLHPQLAELWQTHPVLRRMKAGVWVPPEDAYWATEQHHKAPHDPPDPARMIGDHINLCEALEVGGRKFIPLVRESMALICGVLSDPFGAARSGGLGAPGASPWQKPCPPPPPIRRPRTFGRFR